MTHHKKTETPEEKSVPKTTNHEAMSKESKQKLEKKMFMFFQVGGCSSEFKRFGPKDFDPGPGPAC